MYDITSMEMFDKYVSDADGVIVVDFYTPDCTPCKVVKGHLIKLETEVSVPVYTVDCVALPDIAQEYNVSGVPTIMVFENGILLNESTGLISYDKLYGMVTE